MKCTNSDIHPNNWCISCTLPMPDYRRWYVSGGTVFFTVVTHQRRSIFSNSIACRLLGEVMREIRIDLLFETIASVLLPDHLHTIWALPHGDADYSTRWKRIKREFTVLWLSQGGSEAYLSPAQTSRGARGVWQRRFYEHQVQSEEELAALCDYIHYNPVKHGIVTIPRDWPHSSFARFVEAGQYSEDWGRSDPQIATNLDLE
jgi:putative transposase